MDVRAAATAAHEAARTMLASSDVDRRQALEAVADALDAAWPSIEAANQADLERAEAEGLDAALLQRLALPRSKFDAAILGVRQVAAMPDPLHRTLRATLLVDGLHLRQETVPLGVVACIFESRPDVCIQIPALTIRSGNAVLLKGGSEANATNQAICDAIHVALEDSSIPREAVTLLPGRDEVTQLLAMDDLVDLIIPRGSNALVRRIQDGTRIPVMGHAAGVCHIYVDAAADPRKAERIIMDAKTDYPSACNAVETILVHETMASWWAGMADQLQEAGVTVHKDGFGTEYGALELNHTVVASLEDAMSHIAKHGSKHTDCIISDDPEAQRRFLAGVDSAGVFVNASTRFADGFRYGLGAEVGISTGKLHARGPVGLEGLLSSRWVLQGDGHTAGALKAEDYLHAPDEDRPILEAP